MNLLDSAMNALETGTEESLARYTESLLQEELNKSGSTWKVVNPGSRESVRSGNQYAARDLEGNLYLSTKRSAETEIFLANAIRKRLRNNNVASVSVSRNGLNDSQFEALRVCTSNRISCLSGLPGTGKTYTCMAIASSLSRSMNVVGCALTGIASSRLRESTGLENCTTIHKLLGYEGPEKGYTVEEVDAEAVIVDECSMNDNQLMLSLLSRLRDDTRVIFVGDPNQLSSVEPGDFFREACKVLPHFHLSEVVRSNPDSPIGNASRSILNGSVPQSEDDGTGNGVFLINNSGLSISESINGKRKREKNHPLTVAERMAELDGTELRFVRTMAYTNRTVDSLNIIYSIYKQISSKTPIMCTKNIHNLGVYNGEIGHKEWRDYFFGGRKLNIPSRYVKEAWATTCHKMQGNESQSALLYIEGMMTRRSIYTALTRAKKRFAFVGELGKLEKCINREEERRVTLLSGLIAGDVIVTDMSI